VKQLGVEPSTSPTRRAAHFVELIFTHLSDFDLGSGVAIRSLLNPVLVEY
jgi:hypothetical protein